MNVGHFGDGSDTEEACRQLTCRQSQNVISREAEPSSHRSRLNHHCSVRQCATSHVHFDAWLCSNSHQGELLPVGRVWASQDGVGVTGIGGSFTNASQRRINRYTVVSIYVSIAC